MAGSSDNAPKNSSAEADLGPLANAWRVGGPDYLALRLSFVAKLFDQYLTRLLVEHGGLTLAEWRVIAQLAQGGNCTVRDLARQAWVDRAEVSRAVTGLRRKGLVKKEVNEEDRRLPRFALTPAGHDAVLAFRPHWRSLLAAFTDQRDSAELTLLNEQMTQFAHRLLDLLQDSD